MLDLDVNFLTKLTILKEKFAGAKIFAGPSEDEYLIFGGTKDFLRGIKWNISTNEQ